MSSGRPCVVVSDLASDAAELVGRTRSGAAVAPGDAIGLRRLIMDLRDHPGTAEEMGGRGRQFVVATHSPDAVVSQYDELLRGLVSRS
jgi:glycosyltransferase involved in cell wall biosynthesis